MGEFFNLTLHHSIAMFAIVNPLGVSAILLSLLPQNATSEYIGKIALKSTITIIVAFFVVLFTGNFFLKLFGISIDSLKAMGGIVLLLAAIKMIQGESKEKNSEEEEKEALENEELAVIPIGIPITFGPGIFATIIILRGQSDGFVSLSAIIVGYLLVSLSVYFSLKYSTYIRRYLGLTGQKIVSRLMGLIVGAIAVQFIVSGVSSLAKSYL